MQPDRSPAAILLRKTWPYLLALLLLMASGGVAWRMRHKWQSTLTLFEQAQVARPDRATLLYSELAARMPSLGEYWITSFELEDYRDQVVHIWGTVIMSVEDTKGGHTQGRDGTYFHIKVKKIRVVKED